MAHQSTQQWEAEILGQFAIRDKHEKAFTNMVESYNELVQKLTFFVEQNKHLETSAQSSKEQHDKMARQVTVLREQGIRRLTESNHILAHKNQELLDLVNEKNVTIQVIQDELTTLQLEMGKLDERQRDLERENAQLLQRWLKMKNEEADRMNAQNMFVENEKQEAASLSPPVQSPPSTRSLRSMGPDSPTQSNWRGQSSIFS
ncbi:hypothetical protein BX616_010300, partial [Lobosporangium transversale]